ncbi:glycerophosphodiester phosphodiesterase family protein [Kocuria tytonicola]|uniref:glycerophosphodiester phosphodiesterase family protein n=1 Tax=Kocuria tytonicola TaxID=2055946 RepID=UPI001402D47A|nr:glycerophosphodiester phosphodiesterase family protein [Kocuria tytonicola]
MPAETPGASTDVASSTAPSTAAPRRPRSNLPRQLTLGGLVGGFRSTIGRFLQYQVLAALLVGLVTLPLFRLALTGLIRWSGRRAISSGDYLSFLLSVQGIVLVLVGLLVLSLLVVININGLMLIAADSLKGHRKGTLWGDLKAALASFPRFVQPAGLLILAYVGLVVPLTGMGFGLSALSGLRIPNFITSVIYANPLYMTGYVVLLALLAVVGALSIFVFHSVLLRGTTVWGGFRFSWRLVRQQARLFFLGLLPRLLLLFLIAGAAVVVLLLLAALPGELLQPQSFGARFALLTGLLLAAVVLAIAGFVLAPFAIYVQTAFFVVAAPHVRESRKVEEESGSSPFTPAPTAEDVRQAEHRAPRRRRGLVVGVVAVVVALVVGAAALLAATFDDVFAEHRDMQIVAHRTGGDLAPENSVAGVDAAAKAGAAFSEFDVRRTADGAYMINHDPNLKRVTGDPRTMEEMTSEQITQLKIQNQFGTQPPEAPVPTLDQILDAGKKDQIGMFVELKGPTADHQMAEDVIRTIREKGMEDQSVLLSLDYDLITYIEEKHPEIQTGYLFYFSVGEADMLVGDYLILEEDAATPDRIARIHAGGKKAIVWTVNTKESMEKFLGSEADGLITDHVTQVKDTEEEMSHRTDLQRVVDTLFVG